MSVKLALEKFSRRNSGIKKPRQKRDRAKSPEKQTEKEVMAWLEKNGFAVSVVESKAVYSKSAGRYLRGQTEAGFSDIVGVDGNAYAVFIELKAHGRRNTIRASQVEFLKTRISRGAFCVCTDSVDHVSSMYYAWLDMKNKSEDDARKFLLKDLPKAKFGESDDLFTDDLSREKDDEPPW